MKILKGVPIGIPYNITFKNTYLIKATSLILSALFFFPVYHVYCLTLHLALNKVIYYDFLIKMNIKYCFSYNIRVKYLQEA